MTTIKYDITLMVPLLHFTSNITLTTATSQYLGTGEQADQDSCISNEKNQLILMGNFSRTCKEVPLIHITGGITLKTTLV